jgi:hypothetical protein
MEHLFAIARATQKALTSAHNEFNRELYSVHKPVPTADMNTRIPTTQNTPTLSLTELNRLRDAMYAGGR